MSLGGSRILLVLLLGRATAPNSAGIAFLKANQGKQGVLLRPSGLQYRVLRYGKGSDHPALDSLTECHYEGRTASNYPNGPKFDSSYDRGHPAAFAPNQGLRSFPVTNLR